ncbi:DUF6078 family protein [Prevotella sp. KH2C16]|uniref:DUF6078 family protein n=1 Tax=Prevotella sp. KH2C16 TaxID=1855325 RepID=UPI0008EEC67E|nr:DUF6078 family protein [Prevotella sp. KH2C16]SFF98541.1 hypothetical protein SAMN05216383_103112 [Prevotella sp. KH2C16]
MSTNIHLNYQDVPASYKFCFNCECPLRDDCLHYLAGTVVPPDRQWGTAVFPNALNGGKCGFHRPAVKERMAYGFKRLFMDVKARDIAGLRQKVQEYLGGRTPYYRFSKGIYKLTEEQQRAILDIFAGYGYTENLAFDEYQESYRF